MGWRNRIDLGKVEYFEDNLNSLLGRVPDSLLHWGNQFNGLKEETGMLCKYGACYGFMVRMEFRHTQTTELLKDEWSEANPNQTPSHVFDRLVDLYYHVKSIAPMIQVGVSACGGRFNSHEFIVFFSEGVSNDMYQTIMSMVSEGILIHLAADYNEIEATEETSELVEGIDFLKEIPEGTKIRAYYSMSEDGKENYLDLTKMSKSGSVFFISDTRNNCFTYNDVLNVFNGKIVLLK